MVSMIGTCRINLSMRECQSEFPTQTFDLTVESLQTGTVIHMKGIPTEITTTHRPPFDYVGGTANPNKWISNREYISTFLVSADYLEERGQIEAAKILREACK